MKFDPMKKRKVADEFELDWVLSTKFEPDRPMGNVMASQLNNVVPLILVGHGDAVAPVLPNFISWLKIAIDAREDFGESQNFHQRVLYRALGVYHWICDGITPQAVWDQARIFDAASVNEGVYLKNDLRTERLDDYMAMCIQSRSYTEGICEFEKYYGKLEISSKGKISPREFGYFQCLEKIERGIDCDKVREAGHKMLKANLEDWLGYSQYTRAAIWLKLVNFDIEQKISPVDAILRAYEDMPNIARPDFL